MPTLTHEPGIRFPANCTTPAHRVAFLYRIQEMLRRIHNQKSAAAHSPKQKAAFWGWYDARFQPLHWALARRIPPIRDLVATTGDPDYGERKLAWKADERWEGTEEHRELIDALAVEAPPREPPDPTEDLSAFTEVDSDGDITMSATKCDVDTMRYAANSYVYKSYGANHFGNYEHDFECCCTATGGSGSRLGGVWGVTDDYGAYMQISNGQIVYYSSDHSTIFLNDRGEAKTDYWNSATLGTLYYDKGERSGTACTLKIYTGSIGGTLKDTLSITGANTTWEYLMCCFSRNWTGDATFTYYCQNFDIHEGAAATLLALWPNMVGNVGHRMRGGMEL